MFNDNQLAVYGLLQSGTAYQNPLAGNFAAVSTLTPQLTTQIAAMQTGGQLTPTQASQLLAQVTASQSQSTALETHTTSTIASLTSNLSLATYGIQMSQNLGIGTASPCDQLNSFFGSLLGSGSGLMGQLINGLTQLLGLLVGGAVEAALALLSTIEAAISSIANMIANEIAALAGLSGLGSLVGQMNQLFNFLDIPCASQLINAVGSAALLANLVK